MAEIKRAFVLMPFQQEFDSLYTDLIRPALEDTGYECRRADDFLHQHNVMRDVVTGIASADLIVADLTGRNPNVMYEVGLAHALRIPIILIAQEIDEVPFDLRGYRVVEYSTTFHEVGELQERLKAVAAEHLLGRVEFGSPVTDFVDLGSADVDVTAPGASALESTEPGDDDSTGVLDWLADWDEANEDLGEIAQRISVATVDIGEDIERHGERLQRLGQQPGPGAAGKARRIASMAASDLVGYAGRLDEELPAFERTVQTMSDGGLKYLEWVTVETEEDREGLRSTADGIGETLEATAGALAGMSGMRDALQGNTGVSVELDRAIRKAAGSLSRVIAALEQTEAFCMRARAVVDQKLETSA